LARRMDTTIRFTYVGPAGSEGALAKDMRTRGLSVDYEESTEKTDLPAAVEFVRVLFEVDGDIAIIIASTRFITRRFEGSRVEGLPDNDSPDDDSPSGEGSPG
jgi:hypothetical protein